jgi:hypothetical protein
VVQAGKDLRLALEPSDRARASVSSKELDRDGSSQTEILTAVDLGHEGPSEHVAETVALGDHPVRLD